MATLIERLAYEAGFKDDDRGTGLSREEGEPNVYVEEYPCGHELARFAAALLELCAQRVQSGGDPFYTAEHIRNLFAEADKA